MSADSRMLPYADWHRYYRDALSRLATEFKAGALDRHGYGTRYDELCEQYQAYVSARLDLWEMGYLKEKEF